MSPSFFRLPIWFWLPFFFSPIYTPDGKLYWDVFSSLLNRDHPHLCLSSFYSTQSSFQYLSTIFVQTWQAGDVTLANQRATRPFSTTPSQQRRCTSKIACSCSSRWTANILSQHCNPCEVSLLFPRFLFPKHVSEERHVNKLPLRDLQKAPLPIYKYWPKVSILWTLSHLLQRSSKEVKKYHSEQGSYLTVSNRAATNGYVHYQQM